MRRVIIESPYAGTIAENKSYLRAAMTHSTCLGEAPFASHWLYTIYLNDSDPKERDKGLQMGYAWMEVADLVAFYIDLGWSPGMIKAIKVARLLKRPYETRSIHKAPPQEVVELLKMGVPYD